MTISSTGKAQSRVLKTLPTRYSVFSSRQFLTAKGGKFKMELTFPVNYPFTPPKFKFLTPIYHPNIDDQGAVCLSLLKDGEWKPSTRVASILEGIVGLLVTPNPDDPLVASIAETYQNNRSPKTGMWLMVGKHSIRLQRSM
jgi:hypothetical protein